MIRNVRVSLFFFLFFTIVRIQPVFSESQTITATLETAARRLHDVLNAEQQFQHELEQLRTLRPDVFKGRQFKTYDESGPFAQNADLVFIALTDICANDMACLYQTFPALSMIYWPVLSDDLDHDGIRELVCAPNVIQDTYLMIFRYVNGIVTSYDTRIDASSYKLRLSVRQGTQDTRDIIGQTQDTECLELSGEQRVVPYTTVYETRLRFTGSAIEEIEPFHVADQYVNIEKTSCVNE